MHQNEKVGNDFAANPSRKLIRKNPLDVLCTVRSHAVWSLRFHLRNPISNEGFSSWLNFAGYSVIVGGLRMKL